jgi:hypothetical protein
MMSSQRRSLTLHLDSCHALLERHYAGALRAPGSQPSADQTAERSTDGGPGPLEVGKRAAASRTSCPRCAREGAPAVRTFACGP